MRRSIRTRIVISYIAVALFVVTVLGTIFFVALNRISRSAQMSLLSEISDSLVSSLGTVDPTEPFLAPEAPIRRALDATSLFNSVRIRLVDPAGRVRYRSGRLQAIALQFRRWEELFDGRPSGDAPGEGFMMMRDPMPGRSRGGMMRPNLRPVVPTPPAENGAAPGDRLDSLPPFRSDLSRSFVLGGRTWQIELMGADGFENEFLTPATWVFTLAALAALAITTGAGLWIGRKLTAPIIHLTDQARRMAEGDLSARSSVGGRDEIGRLSRQFNTMADRLDESFREISRERDTLRRFAGDASHELRTPITALSTFIDLMENRLADGGDARLHELVGDSREQLDRLETLVAALLDLTRLDGAVIELQREQGDVRSLAEAAWRGMDPARREAASLDPPADVPLRGDLGRLQAVLRNLFENALHARPDATISVRAWEVRGADQSEVTVIRVADDGPGVAEEELSRLFERFYRSPSNRSPGSGLGLSIVEGIVALHGGTIRAFNGDRSAGEGLVVEFEIPA